MAGAEREAREAARLGMPDSEMLGVLVDLLDLLELPDVVEQAIDKARAGGVPEADLVTMQIERHWLAGRFDAAKEQLERVEKPDDALAINLLRMAKLDSQGDKARIRAAEEHFRALLAAPENDWVTSLATQELARFQAGHQQMQEAIVLLETTLKKRPDDQELLVQLAFYYDRLENNTATKLLDRVAHATTSPGEAPRGRYNQWQSEALTRDRTELQGGARQRLAILDRALVTTEHQEGR